MLTQLKAIPARTLSGRFWHQGPVEHALLSTLNPPQWAGRYHLEGGRSAWYASNREQASWAEMFRHLSVAVSPFEIRRRVGCVDITGLHVLDLTNQQNLDTLGITSEQLVDNDVDLCQQIATAAGDRFEGILGPSAALRTPGAQTLAVFPNGMAKLHVIRERVRPAPPRLADLLNDIALHHDAPLAVISLLRVLAIEGAEAIRRRRRRPEPVLDITDSSEAETS